MTKATEIIQFLAHFNSWRRGDETIEQPSPAEIGAAIDDAVNLLRKYDEIERENVRLRADRDDWKAKHWKAHDDFHRQFLEMEKLLESLEIARKTLDDIHLQAHCIAKAGPLNTPTLQDAWGKFMEISAKAGGAAHKISQNLP